MTPASASRRSVVLATVLTGLVLSGCAASAHPAGPKAMGGAGDSEHSTGSAMMGPGSDYHLSRSTCSAPKALPGTTVSVTLGDMGMTQMMGGTAPLGLHMMLRATPTNRPAGRITFVVSNRGWRTHELVILPLSPSGAAGRLVPGADGKVDEKGSLGEASGSCAVGTGEGIRAGTVGWTTVTLPAGRYELICNFTNHYADGMHQELVVS